MRVAHSGVVTWRVSGPHHGQLPLLGSDISLKYRARPHGHLPASPALAGGDGRGEVVGGRDGSWERDSPDTLLSCLSAHHNPLLSHSDTDTLTVSHRTQVIMSGFNTSQFTSLPAVLLCLFVFFKVLRYRSHSHVLHRRVKYNLR